LRRQGGFYENQGMNRNSTKGDASVPTPSRPGIYVNTRKKCTNMIYFDKINSLATCNALEPLFNKIEHDVLINMKIEDRGDLNNAMSTL